MQKRKLASWFQTMKNMQLNRVHTATATSTVLTISEKLRTRQEKQTFAHTPRIAAPSLECSPGIWPT